MRRKCFVKDEKRGRWGGLERRRRESFYL